MIIKCFVAAALVVACAGKELALGPIMLEQPVAGSGSSSPFPGFSWSEHPRFFKDVSKALMKLVLCAPFHQCLFPGRPGRGALMKLVACGLFLRCLSLSTGGRGAARNLLFGEGR